MVNVFTFHQAGTTAWSHETEILFGRLAAISQMLIHPYFVFDGPGCPQLQRGKDIVFPLSPPLLLQRFQELLTVFGFDWHIVSGLVQISPDANKVCQAPGEADAELAYLQTYGLLDAVVTPYNDSLLFGAPSVIRR